MADIREEAQKLLAEIRLLMTVLSQKFDQLERRLTHSSMAGGLGPSERTAFLDSSVRIFGLASVGCNALVDKRIATVRILLSKTRRELPAKGFGKRSRKIVKESIEARGLWQGMSEDQVREWEFGKNP